MEIQFTAPSFVAPARVQFRYRLEGFDREWVDAGTRRTAYYTNLSPGRYTFQVQAANSDGVWNRTSASLEFELQPHLYQTAWFYTLCGLALTLGGWGIHLLRLRFLLQRQARAATRPPPARTIGESKLVGQRVLAHAMKGDRERCLAAQMDGYVAKPIKAEELFEEIESVVGQPSPPKVKAR